jgi:multidrug efflux system membrane fusion protein
MPRFAVTASGLACLAALTFAGCGNSTTQAFDRPPAPVTVAAAIQRDVPVYLDEIGKCVAREVVSVQPQVSGRITGIHFTDGADVKVGDALFTIDPRPFQAELDRAQANLAKDTALEKQAEANLAKDIAQARNAEVQAQRYADLIKQEGVTKEQYDQVRTDAEALQATVNADRAALASAQQAIQVDKAAIASVQVQLGYCFIHSPINGRAGRRLADIGNVVDANTGSLLVIQRLDPIYADFTVTENDLTSVQRSMARGTLNVEVRLPDVPEAPMLGRLTFLDNAVQEATGTVMLRATIPNPDRQLWPGRFVKVRLVLSKLRDAVLVPETAPQMSAKGPFVFVVKEDSTAEMRPVKTGQREDDLVVIDQGIKPGERVVVSGQLGVTPGGKVHIEQPQGAGSEAATADKGDKR